MIWLQAIRPKTLVASICPVGIGTLLASSAGSFHLLLFLSTLATALGIQIATNLINDYQDFLKGADTLARTGPPRVTSLGLVSVKKMQQMTLACIALTLISGSYLIFTGGLWIGMLLAISLLLAYSYTAGPFPLAYLGLGELFVFIFFGPLAVGITYFLQTKELSLSPFIAGIAPGALSCAILVANNLRDHLQDKAAHKKTLVVRFGTHFGEGEYLALLCLSLCTPLYFFSSHPFSLLALFTSFSILPLIPLLRNHHYQHLFTKTAPLLFLYTLLFCIGHSL